MLSFVLLFGCLVVSCCMFVVDTLLCAVVVWFVVLIVCCWLLAVECRLLVVGSFCYSLFMGWLPIVG